MSVTVTVPDIGGAEGAEVVEILVAVGDQVELEQSLIVLESDKASMEPSTSPLMIIGRFFIAPSFIRADIASKDCAVIFLRSISRFKRCLSETIRLISFSFSTTAKMSAD